MEGVREKKGRTLSRDKGKGAERIAGKEGERIVRTKGELGKLVKARGEGGVVSWRRPRKE